MKTIPILLLILVLPAMVSGDQVYRWVDEKGVVYFTDDLAAIPEDQRNDAENRQMPGSEPRSTVVAPTEDKDEDILIEDDLKEKDEKWWRSRAEKWRLRLQAGYDDYEKVRLQYNTKVAEYNTSKDPDEQKDIKAELEEMQADMKRFKSDIESARKMTEEVLPAQAQKAGKPIEWVR
jgi:hypothetical protein